MRILITTHIPLAESTGPAGAGELAAGLVEAGHQVECLVVGGAGDDRPGPCPVHRVRCGAGDESAALPFDAPDFVARADGGPTFAELSDEQLEEYRNVLRRELDAIVDRFDPHVIHCEHVWLLGHLAAETGAPYVLAAQSIELDAGQADARYQRFAEEAAENAGRVIAATEEVDARVREQFGDLEGRIAVVPNPADAAERGQWIAQIEAVYAAALHDRFGPYWPERP